MALSKEAAAGLIGAFGGAVIGGGLGIVGTLLAADMAADRQEQFALPGQVSIDPIEDVRSVVGRTTRITGTADIPRTADRTLWVVVRVDLNGATTYYPQGRADPDASGQWNCVISLGSPDPSEDGPYMAIAVLVDGSTARSFREYVTDELPDDDDGMADYPATEDLRMASIPLQRDISLDDPSLQDEHGSCDT